jgi:nitroimidazol reductase NimA-like FMN-containing flavoprotein (pyridoxamine 5'-phosphate oxidase superfamily)
LHIFITIINNARVARLATIDSGLKPYLVPVVFVYDNDGSYYIPIDKKFKQSSEPGRLKRVKNIEANPNVASLTDEHTEEWGETLFYYDPRNSFTGG